MQRSVSEVRRPLVLYLDNQDYINIFNESGDGPNTKVLSELLKLRDGGHLIIGFSFATIVEFITKPDTDHRSERVRRGELIREICGKNAFPFVTDLKDGDRLPNNGQWMPLRDNRVISAREFRRDLEKMLLKKVAEETASMNREQRRKLQSKASLRRALILTSKAWGHDRSDYGNLPVSDEIIKSRIVQKLICGLCSEAEFEEKINAWLSDPAEFSRLFYDYADHPNMKDHIFGAAMKDLENAAAKLQEAINQVQNANAFNLKLRKRMIEHGLDKKTARQATKQIAIPDFEELSFSEKLGSVLGKDRIGHLEHYARKSFKLGYKFRQSDFLDLVHMCYAYDCDLFRCDIAMANMFIDFEPFRDRLVARFRDLPEHVVKRLNSI